MSVGVLVVDDQPLYRGAARAVIDATRGFEFLGEAVSGDDALEAVAKLEPDMVLLNVRMREVDGVETCRRLSSARPEAVVVLLSVDDILCLSPQVGFCGAVEVVRKQELQPAVLRRIWHAHGARRATAESSPQGRAP
jgi:DNA-binding NarL/FixJ family response regulator